MKNRKNILCLHIAILLVFALLPSDFYMAGGEYEQGSAPNDYTLNFEDLVPESADLDITISGVDESFTLFDDEIEDDDSLIHKSTGIEITNNSRGSICVSTKAFTTLNDSPKIVYKGMMAGHVKELALGVISGDGVIAWFDNSGGTNKWVREFAEFYNAFPVIESLRQGETDKFYVVSVLGGEFNKGDKIKVNFYINVESL